MKRGFINKSLWFLFLAASSSPILAAVTAKGPNSKLTIEQNQGQLVFKIEPNKDLAISTDAPWSVKLSNVQNLTPAALSLGRKDFDGTIPGFKIPLTVEVRDKPPTDSKSPGISSFDYSLTAFICTIDKKKCFRDVIKGKAVF